MPIGARLETRSKAQRRLYERQRKRKLRALAAVERSLLSPGLVSRIEAVVEDKDRERARRHRRPAPVPTLWQALRPALTEAERAFGDKLAELHNVASIARTRVTAAYETAGSAGAPGAEDSMSDGKARAWHRYAELVRLVPVEVRDAVVDVTVFGRNRDPAEAVAGIKLAVVAMAAA